jgi:predicted ribosomally synthesized peptide with nif11-like leader
MDFKDFRRKLATDRAFAKQFENCHTPEELVAAAAQEGYSFSVEDIKNDTELLPEEIAQVSGGGPRMPLHLAVNTAFSASPKVMNGR